jgi:hypothetical protein
LALAIVAASGIAARAQTQPWPNSAPQAQGWPGAAQPAPAQAPWPGGAQPAPAQTPWPAAAQPGPAQSPWPAGQGGGGPPMMGGGPTPEQVACMKGFSQYREETEKRGLAAKSAGERKVKVTREEFCKLVTAYSDSEVKWIKFTAENMTKCGIPKEILEQIKAAHVHTAEAKTKICSAGPAPGAPATPTLSDALGTSSLPTPETEKRKTRGGTLDTLTGNALAR